MLKKIVYALAFLLLLSEVSLAAPGGPDTTFGEFGFFTYDGSDMDEGSGVAIQEDGKIAIVGKTQGASKFFDVLVLRLNPDGTLDNTFGGDGVVTYDGGSHDRGYGIAIQKDGKIVVVGYTSKDTWDVLVLRYNPDGTLDNTFGDNGVVTYDGGYGDVGKGIAIQENGKIVVVGESYKSNSIGTVPDVLILRYNPDGTLDNTFGDNGVVTYDSGDGDSGYGIAIQEDGKIVVVGERYNDTGTVSDVLVLRYTPDGTRDNTFGGDGVVTYDSGDMDSGNGIAIQENGKIVVVGERYDDPGTVSDVLVLRYNPDGTRDNTFSGDGVAIYDSGNLEGSTGIAIQEDGKIVIVGKSRRDVLVLRLNTNGTLDKTFGQNGIINWHYLMHDEVWGNAVAIQRDGNIIIAGGSYYMYYDKPQYDVLALRIHGGDPDKTPPTPNPMTWETEPHQTGTDSIAMVATTATDNDPISPISYYFDFVGSPTGGLGGKDSIWQEGTSYTNSNLQANHNYGYRVKAKDGLNNQTAYSTTQYAFTAIQPPTGITFGTITSTSIQARSTNTPSGLSRGSSGLWIENTNGTNSGWKRDNTLWTSKSLLPNKSYSFQAKARNGDGTETGYNPPAPEHTRYTRANPPGQASFSDLFPTSIRANWTANGNPSGTQYFCENVTTRTNSGWITDTSWNSDNLPCGISYSFRVKAKNEEGIETGWTSLGSPPVKCIILRYPNGGEMIPSGSNYDIQWETTPAAVSFDLFYSLDNGVSWPLIKKDERNTIYSWQVPKTTGNKKACFVKVIGYNDARTKRIGSDTSDKPFTIEVVTVTNPNGGGEPLHAGDPFTIEWRGCSDAVTFNLMVSFDSGATWRIIDDKATPEVIEGKGVKGTFLTTKVPSPGTGNSKTCFIKVIAYNAAGKQIGSDTSDKPFTIEVVAVTKPNGGELLHEGWDETIEWDSYETSEPITKVQLYYTKDGGATYYLITTLSGSYPPGSYSQLWTVPPVGTTSNTKCKVKVVLKDRKGVVRGSDVSDNYFTIELSDLIETFVSDPPTTALPGGGFSVTDTTKNQGKGNAIASTTQYYLSVNDTKGTGDILLIGHRDVPALPVGESSTGTAEVTIPSSTAAGTYYLLACADDKKKVAESNETNNCFASTSTMQVIRPDLIETSVTNPPATAIVGIKFSVTDTAKNQGKADAGPSTTRYYLSADKIKGSTDILLEGSRSVPALAVGESSTAKVDVTIPSGLGAPAYLLACADDMNVVAESNETNNCIASTSTVQITGPDLIETFVTNPPLTSRAGSTFSVTDTVKNQGNVAAGPSVIQYYLSGDKIKDSKDIVVGGRWVSNLAPGTASSGTEIVTIPSGTAAGAYYLLACADDMEAVDETDETNNCIASSNKVQVMP